MSAVGPGDFVICVDATPITPARKVPVTEGALYQVRAFTPRRKGGICPRDKCGTLLVHLVGVFGGGCPNRFRPLIDPDAQLVDEEKELEDA